MSFNSFTPSPRRRKAKSMVHLAFFLILHLFFLPLISLGQTVPGVGAEICDEFASASGTPTGLAAGLQDIACVQRYQEKRCAAFKASLDPADRNKVMTCSEEDSLSVGKVFFSCGAGAAEYVVDIATGVVHLISQLPHLPAAFANTLVRVGQGLEKCNNDSNFRRALFSSVAPLYTEAEQQGMLRELSCEGLLQTVRQQSQNAIQDIQRKKQLQEQFKRRSPDGTLPAHLQISAGEEQFQQRYFAAADAEKARLNTAVSRIWQRLQSQLGCFNKATQIEMTCHLIAKMTTETVTAGAATAILKSARALNTLHAIEVERFSATEVIQTRADLEAPPEPALRARTDPTSPLTENDLRQLGNPPGGGRPQGPSLQLVRELDATSKTTDTGLADRVLGFKPVIDVADRQRRQTAGVAPSAVTELARTRKLTPSQLSYSKLNPLAGRKPTAQELSMKSERGVLLVKLNSPRPEGHPKFIGVNEVHLVTLGDGTRGIWKPHREVWTSNYRAEVLAYEIDQRLGFNLVPPTVERTIGGEVGSFQLFTDSKRGAKPKVEQLQKQSLFDFLIENKDRHGGNMLVQDSGQVVSIDNGLSFTGIGDFGRSFAERETGIASFLRSSEGEKIVENLRSYVASPKTSQELADYLGQEDANRTLQRMRKIIEYNDALER